MTGDYTVVVPSWGRAGRVKCFETFPTAVLYVAERQRADYVAAYPDAVVESVPDELDGIGQVADKYNWMLAQLERNQAVLFLDDDVRGIGVYDQGRHRQLSIEEAAALVRCGFALAHQMGAPLWGLNILRDQRAYSVMRPFKLLAPILGPFTGHLLPHGLRFDRTLGAKQDYDLWLQAIQKFRRTLRVDKYHYLKHEEVRGGFYSVRTMEWELATCRAIERKWGTKVIRYEASKKNILDARVHIPIPGC